MNDELKKKYAAALEKLTPEYIRDWIKSIFPEAYVEIDPASIRVDFPDLGVFTFVDITTEDKLDHAAMANKVQWACKAYLIAMLNAVIPKE